MMNYFARILTACLCMMTMAFGTGAVVRAEEDTALVTMVDGKVRIYAKGSKSGVLAKKNDRIAKGGELKVADKSRVELRFADGTVMRFAQNTSVKMDEVMYDGKTGDKKVRVDMGGGKVWANVKKLATADSRVEVKTTNAVAGVRGKVYDGSVDVSGTAREAPKPPAPTGGPVEVPGPHVVPPPYHEVTMEEWHVIVKSFQQVTISPQGVPSEPQDFNPQQDMDDWVKWNQERDKLLRF
jgi:hypothetical protein